jgi:hypothetical protein
MKTFKILLTCSILFSLTSCLPTNFIQVCKTESDKNLIFKDGNYVYEDDNCVITYDLWDEWGNVGFKIYNKTEKNIYLDLKECFLIMNGMAYDYYKNRASSYSGGIMAAPTFGNNYSSTILGFNYSNPTQKNQLSEKNASTNPLSFGYSVSISQEELVAIPPQSAKILKEYYINNNPFRTCDLLKYPKKKEIKTAKFSKERSPLVFANRLAYRMEGTTNLIRITHDFFVSEITNYPERVAYESVVLEYCGQKSTEMIQRIKYTSSDKFYIKYKKGGEFSKY